MPVVKKGRQIGRLREIVGHIARLRETHAQICWLRKTNGLRETGWPLG
jgi:hypothetical protein